MDAIERDALLNLPDLERAEAFAELLTKNNWDQQTLAEHLEICKDKVSRYLTPLKLCDEVKEAIRILSPQNRPCLSPLEILCKVESELQKELFTALPPGLSANKQEQWLREICARRGAVLSKNRYRRSYRAKRVDRLTLNIATTGWKIQWYIDEMSRMTAAGRDIALGVDDYPKRRKMLWDALQVLLQQLETFESVLKPRLTAFGKPLGCVWPVGDPGTQAFRFCGADVLAGKPYCVDHAAIAYVRPGKKKPKSDGLYVPRHRN